MGEILEENQHLRREMAALRALLSGVEGKLAERDAMLEALQRKAEYLAQRLELVQLEHTRPASQRYVPEGQEALPFDPSIVPPPRTPTPDVQSDEEETEKTPKKRRGGKKTPRRRNRDDFADLPAKPVHCAAADETCIKCGGPLKVIGQAESFRIDWVPGHFVRHDVARDKCACPNCPDQGVLTVTGPYALDRSMAANGLVARIIVDKFADHIPANRQAKRMRREGFEVGSHTLSSWIGKTGSALRLLARAVRTELFTKNTLQGDDTGMPVQDGGDGKLRKGRMWAFTDQEQVFYAFTDTKEGKEPAALLKDFNGELLLVDGGSEFNRVVREKDLERAGCWSHLRTYFHKARQHHPTEAHLALGTLHDLFMIERDIWGKPPDVVRAARQKHSKPLVDGFFEWVKALSQVTRPDSILGKALTYAVNQEPYLRVFLEHGDVPMHNNLSELMLRQTVVGRKNWLFARSEGGAKAAATLYTLIGSCHLQGIDPWFYLRDVLDRLLDYPGNRLAELTPKNWRLAREHHTDAHR